MTDKKITCRTHARAHAMRRKSVEIRGIHSPHLQDFAIVEDVHTSSPHGKRRLGEAAFLLLYFMLTQTVREVCCERFLDRAQ